MLDLATGISGKQNDLRWRTKRLLLYPGVMMGIWGVSRPIEK
jgi:hypothetical protein